MSKHISSAYYVEVKYPKFNPMHKQRKATALRKEAARYRDGFGKSRKLARDSVWATTLAAA